MPLQVEITTSYGTFECAISELVEDGRPVYECDVLRQNAEAGRAYEIYHAIFRMRYDDNGVIVPVRHAKTGPVPDYWEEMYAKVREVILANN